MNRRYFASLLACSLTGLALAGCHTDSATTADNTASPAAPAASGAGGPVTIPGGAVPAGTKVSLAFVTNNPSDYWTIARKGTEKAQAGLPDVDVQFEIPANGTAAEQKTIIDNLLAKGVKGIAISPVDPANQVQLLNDTAKKAIVFTQDSDSPTSDRMCYVGTDNHAAGVMAGEAMKKSLPNGGKIMLFVGKKDAQNAKERAAGIMDALKGSKIEVIDTRTDDADHARAKANAADTLVKYPDLAGMMGLWSYNGPAIVNAVKEAGKVGKVKIVCFDEEDGTLLGIQDGSIDGTVVQQPYEFGKQAIELMDKVAHGDTSVIPTSKTIYIPTRLIDKSSVADFSANLKKLRGK